ncbi:hypothetical protein KAFR_0C01890 [Kazachstania africana CBS 2517]|uniref:Uncharacterized protein n=1 Tax=Kazachstania africana (strain ATCC 22294 / BCRC 22015 / CBS 2517 / CECT 1963 / NBRC 1671 / NRRL Y-8276) TaxID=1071382 RepID=H2AS32_KAZAF|nr:hypothetical protein KAFR_0C01890 [Kazachstania africana CBS 2517]CCF57182.1 hypothetical protein KAFR_0C01890 [Kazachstania africana CBS 2517]
MFFIKPLVTVSLFMVYAACAIASTGSNSADLHQTEDGHYPDVPLPRDNTTSVDALNVLRCVQVNGYPNSTLLGVDNDGFLAFLPGVNNIFNTSYARNVSACAAIYGYRIVVTIHSGTEFEDGVHPIGTLADIISAQTRIGGIIRAARNAGIQTDLQTMISPRLERRANSYYYTYMADDSNCGSYEMFIDTTSMCQDNNKNSFASFRAENPSTKYNLDFAVWPHHDCLKGNQQLYALPPLYTLPCKKRKTYSWFGALQDESCFGANPSEACVTADLNVYTGSYVAWRLIVEGKYS